MKRKIFLSISLPILFFVIIASFLSTWIVYDAQVSHMRQTLKETTTLLSENYTFDKDQPPFLQPDFRLTLISSQGTVFYDSHYDQLENHLDRPEIISALQQGEGSSQRFSTTYQKTMLYHATLLQDGSVLRLSFVMDSLLKQFISTLPLLLISLFIIIFISFLLAHFLTSSLLRPITTINLDHPLNNTVYPELHPLLLKMDQHNQLRKEFTANVSHELKTPLTSIQGYAEIMANNLQGDKTQEFSQKILFESKRLLFLIQDIMKLSHLDEGNIHLDYEMINYTELIETLVLEYSSLAKDKGVELHNELHQPLSAEGIPLIIKEVISNLIHNSVKYNRASGKVILKGYEDSDSILLIIQDTGLGIPDEDQHRIFERFYRSQLSYDHHIEGTGLGLAIVKHGVEFHHGTIQMESQLNQGTTFTITLPKKKKNSD